MSSSRRATIPKAIMELCLPVTVKTEGKWRVASIQTLDLHAQGRTKKDALEHLLDISYDFFVSCIERRTLDEVLCQAGLMPVSDVLRKKIPAPRDGHEHITVRVPLGSNALSDAERPSAS